MFEAKLGARRITRAATMMLLLMLIALPVRAQEQPNFEQMSSMLSLMHNFYGLMTSVHDMASQPEKAALLQMHEIEEIYKRRGELAKAIPVYRDVLANTKHPTIRAMAHMKLADVLKKTGQQDQSIEVLRDALNESLEQAKQSTGG